MIGAVAAAAAAAAVSSRTFKSFETTHRAFRLPHFSCRQVMSSIFITVWSYCVLAQWYSRQRLCGSRETGQHLLAGCSMPVRLARSGFKGLVLVSASPRLYVKNLQDAIPTNHFLLTMPPIKKGESLKMATVVGVAKALVLENYNT